MTTATVVAAWIGAIVSVIGTGYNTFGALRAEHLARQQSRRETYRYAPPWWMCWPFWIGIERRVFGPKLSWPEGTWIR